MWRILPILVLLVCGCGPSQKPRGPSSPGILDKVLGEAIYSDTIKQAERDLPGDDWVGPPMRHNASRSKRESAVAQRMLAEISPELKRMSVPELIRALKVTSRYTPEEFVGVADNLFAQGNELIIAEIESRPKSELVVLPGLADQSLQVWQGPQGGGDSLDTVIHHRILKDR